MLNVIEYLEAAAREKPDKTAFADDKKELTFGQLLSDSRRIGTAIAGIVGGCNRPVPVLAERSADTISAFMGIVSSGNYYVPLDSRMPQKRLERILEQINPPFIVAQQENEKKAAELSPFCRTVMLDKLKEVPEDAA